MKTCDPRIPQDKIRVSFDRMGVDPGAMTGKAFAKFVDTEITKWGQVVRRARIMPQ